ncbi:MAG: hypothetical protein WBF77_05565 [Sulfurimonadaceae bacterium]
MKNKLMISLVAAPLLLSTIASAEVDLKTSGQAVLYYETHQDDGVNDQSLFNQDDSLANVGVQLNVGGDLGNNFTFGSQLSYLGTAGLNRNLVGDTNVHQVGGSVPLTQTAGASATTNDLALTKIFVAKQIGNTTAKIGRQELPKSLSPFAYSEGWHVFKNTFEAVLLVNTDIPDTTLVGAAVGGGTSMVGAGLSEMSDGVAVTDAGKLGLNGAAYMLTAQNKSIPMTTLTLSYYSLVGVGEKNDITGLGVGAGDGMHADAVWLDAQIADKALPLGLNFGLQGGSIMPDDKYTITGVGTVDVADTVAIGAKAGMKFFDALDLTLAYTSVDGDDNKVNVAIKNTGTGIKSPLYTQMIYNQDAIALDADTFMLKAAYNTGDYGTVIAQYAGTSAGMSNLQGSEKDYAELDVMYKLKAGGVQYFAAYINRSIDQGGSLILTQAGAEKDDRVRLWARVNF